MTFSYSYVQYLKTIKFLLTAQLTGDAIEDLKPELLSHIGAGWKAKCDPRDVTAIIFSDYVVPAGALILEEQRR